MSDRRRRPLLLTALLWLSLTPFEAANAELTGVVFVDQSGDGIRSADEPGLANVRVSNGRESTLTDEDGRYTLAADGPQPAQGSPCVPSFACTGHGPGCTMGL